MAVKLNFNTNNGHDKRSPLFCFFVSILQKIVYSHFKDVSGGHKVSKITFNEIQMKLLEQNTNVKHVSDCSISYNLSLRLKQLSSERKWNTLDPYNKDYLRG
jgi:hypothetical protein